MFRKRHKLVRKNTKAAAAEAAEVATEAQEVARMEKTKRLAAEYEVMDGGAPTREYTVKPLALYSRPQTKIPEVEVVAPSQDGNKEMCSRGGACSSEDAK